MKPAALNAMREIELLDFQRDVPLPMPIYNEAGRLLSPAGTVLDDSIVTRIRQRFGPIVYVPIDAVEEQQTDEVQRPQSDSAARPTDTAPELILQALSKQHDKPDGRELRRAERHTWCIAITLELEEPGISNTQAAQVTTTDLSLGGFGFVFNRQLAAGTIARARFETLPTQPTISAVVRSCMHLAGFQYRIGAQFVRCDGDTE